MASRFPSGWLDELRSRNDIIQIVSGYVSLKKNGRKYWGLCPFHGEKTASFSVDAERQLYYCFGCKAGGNVINFIMEIERIDFSEAVKILAERVHMPLPEMENSEDYERRRSQRERLLEANKAAARFYHENLFLPEGAEILAYLKKRGLSDGVIRKFGLGAAPHEWDALTKRLLQNGFTLDELQLAGLTVRKDSDSEGTARNGSLHAFDMFRNRAIFPIIDQYGNVLAFGGRTLGNHQPKYLNTADTPVFNKRKGVYAANLLRKERHLDRVILVEGYMDVVSLTQYGINGVCATLGTALTNEQARLIKRFAPKVYLGYDGDSAGQHAILRGLEIFEEENIPVRVLDFPDKLDPDEFIRRDGEQAFRALPAISAATYRIRRFQEQHDLSSDEGKIAFTRSCADILSKLDPVEREPHIRALVIQTGFPREVILAQIGVSEKNNPAPEQSEELQKKKAKQQLINRTVPDDVLLAQELLLSLLATNLLPEGIAVEQDFEDPELKSLYMDLKRGVPAASLIDRAPDEPSRSRYARILLSPITEDTDEMITMANDCVNRIRQGVYNKRLKEIMSQVSVCSDNAEKSLLLREAQDISAKLQKMKQ